MDFWSNFWDVIGWFLWAFVFITYLMAVFAIIGDLFRDSKLSGVAKAVWMVFLVFLPFLTALVYLIARGKGMAERQSKQVTQSQSAADDYIRSVAGSSPTSEIERAKSLLDSGAISPDEFAALKARALAHQA